MRVWCVLASTLLVVGVWCAEASAGLRVGAAVVDATPVRFPVLVNGGMRSRSANQAHTPIYARSLVLDDGRERIAIVVVDSCMMPRTLLDEAKHLAAQRTKIRPDRMLISATHTHTAPSAMGALGTDADTTYIPLLREKLAEAIAAAEARLQPAEVGWAATDAADYTALRRWIYRPDRVAVDPFGNRTVRANMHAARNLDDVTGESGPEDPTLSLIAFRSTSGQPLAVLANFSMHYFSGVPALNYDYFGLFCRKLEERIGGKPAGEGGSFVAIMSHGCSGDIWRRDYRKPAKPEPTIEQYSEGLAQLALAAYETVQYEDADLAMAERRLPMRYRVPDQQRLQWARQVVEQLGDRLPQSLAEVYAREQIFLDQMQSTEVVVQAIRIGKIGIGSTPNETYALTGLKIKLQSPLERTMVIELANGGDGYIPPPEQHVLGGYNTWPARTAGLEVEAEPRITEAVLQLLEQVSERPRRVFRQSAGAAAEATLALRPVAYWRMDEWAGPRAIGQVGHRDGIYEPGVVFFLDGPRSDLFCQGGEVNRAAHFAGGRLRTRLDGLADRYTISLWFWNGMPNQARGTTGWLFSRDRDHGIGPHGDHLGLGGTSTQPGKLIFLHGSDREGAKPVVGRTTISRWTWNHVALVRDGQSVRVYLNGDPHPEIDVRAAADFPPGFASVFFGGRSDNQDNWEGRLDEIAVFDRVLTASEIRRLAAAD